MATIPTNLRGLSRLAVATCLLALLAPPSAAAGPARPVAFYDGDAVLAQAATLAGGDARLARLVARHEAEVAGLRDDVDALRDELAHAAVLPVVARRDVEARLAQRTIALLVARTEGTREIELERGRLAERLQQGVAAVVARVAHERDLPVVVRTDADTVVLDPDAVDLTRDVLAALGAAPDAGPGLEPMPASVRQRARLQACAPATEGAPDVVAR